MSFSKIERGIFFQVLIQIYNKTKKKDLYYLFICALNVPTVPEQTHSIVHVASIYKVKVQKHQNQQAPLLLLQYVAYR